jgi:hypothetical protein
MEDEDVALGVERDGRGAAKFAPGGKWKESGTAM